VNAPVLVNLFLVMISMPQSKERHRIYMRDRRKREKIQNAIAEEGKQDVVDSNDCIIFRSIVLGIMRRDSVADFSLQKHYDSCEECRIWHRNRNRENRENKDDRETWKGCDFWHPTQEESNTEEKLDDLNKKLRDAVKDDYDLT
jgi:hypothetical protein